MRGPGGFALSTNAEARNHELGNTIARRGPSETTSSKHSRHLCQLCVRICVKKKNNSVDINI